MLQDAIAIRSYFRQRQLTDILQRRNADGPPVVAHGWTGQSNVAAIPGFECDRVIECDGAIHRVDQTRLKTSEPLVPPNPKLFLRAKSIFMSRAVLAQ